MADDLPDWARELYWRCKVNSAMTHRSRDSQVSWDAAASLVVAVAIRRGVDTFGNGLPEYMQSSDFPDDFVVDGVSLRAEYDDLVEKARRRRKDRHDG